MGDSGLMGGHYGEDLGGRKGGLGEGRAWMEGGGSKGGGEGGEEVQHVYSRWNISSRCNGMTKNFSVLVGSIFCA